MYCLMKATHSEHKQLVGKQFVDLEKGQFVFGRKKAALELNMKESTVRDYINLLKQDNAIRIKSTNKFSIITIVNWEVHQHEDDDDRQQNDSKMTTERQQNDTNKNVKNVKNVKNNSRKYIYDDTHYNLAEHFYKRILENNHEHKEPNLEKWASDIRLMMERDNRNEEQIKYLIDWVQNDDFEMANVLSPSKLRKRFDQLVIKIKQQRRKPQPNRTKDIDWEGM